VRPKPAQSPPEVWLGGIAPAELRRVGRLADGWLPSFVDAEQAHAGKEVVERTADEHGRSIDAEHYGALLPYSFDPVPDEVLALLGALRPGADPSELVAVGTDTLVRRIGEFIDVGFSKFVAVPLIDPAGPIDQHLAQLSAAVRPLEN
jgi:alkanesulfonate monooxygenase SsuD/methylene tetrahydromethanopterin reductase-like flavin-dependent oxidoreductase (luciferase family)